jgi:alpha-tubulin suppressor-like RCC1 family protein
MKSLVTSVVVPVGVYACVNYDASPIPTRSPTVDAATGVESLTASNILAIAPGRFGSCVVTKERALWCLGRTQSAELARLAAPTDTACVGQGGASTTNVWERLSSVGLVDKLANGTLSKCALHDGAIRCWGDNQFGQLGHAPGAAADVRCGAAWCNSVPTAVTGAAGVRFTDLSAGSNHFCASAESGDVYCWGSNALGQVGTGPDLGTMLPTKVVLPGSARARKIATGSSISCAALEPIGLACWGFNANGSAGVAADGGAPIGENCGGSKCISVPTLVPGADVRIDELDSNELATCFVRAQGLYCFGKSRDFSLGVARVPDVVYSPPQQPIDGVTSPTSVTLGQYGGLVFSEANVVTWGFNGRGATASGLPTVDDAGTRYALAPAVRATLSGSTLAALAFDGTGMALRKGELLGWGPNECGQLAHPPGEGDDACVAGVPCRAVPTKMLP